MLGNSKSIALIVSLLTVQDVNAFSSKVSRNTQTSLFMSSELNRRDLISSAAAASAVLLSTPANARLEAVNRPDLLPKEAGLNVIQIEKFLTSGQAKRMNDLLSNLERDTGFRVRVLCQAYPQTPGLVRILPCSYYS